MRCQKEGEAYGVLMQQIWVLLMQVKSLVAVGPLGQDRLGPSDTATADTGHPLGTITRTLAAGSEGDTLPCRRITASVWLGDTGARDTLGAFADIGRYKVLGNQRLCDMHS